MPLRRIIFSSDCEAWVHGPVYRMFILNITVLDNPIQLPLNSNPGDGLTSFERSLIDSILKNFAIFNGKVLERIYS